MYNRDTCQIYFNIINKMKKKEQQYSLKQKFQERAAEFKYLLEHTSIEIVLFAILSASTL